MSTRRGSDHTRGLRDTVDTAGAAAGLAGASASSVPGAGSRPRGLGLGSGWKAVAMMSNTGSSSTGSLRGRAPTAAGRGRSQGRAGTGRVAAPLQRNCNNALATAPPRAAGQRFRHACVDPAPACSQMGRWPRGASILTLAQACKAASGTCVQLSNLGVQCRLLRPAQQRRCLCIKLDVRRQAKLRSRTRASGGLRLQAGGGRAEASRHCPRSQNARARADPRPRPGRCRPGAAYSTCKADCRHVAELAGAVAGRPGADSPRPSLAKPASRRLCRPSHRSRNRACAGPLHLHLCSGHCPACRAAPGECARSRHARAQAARGARTRAARHKSSALLPCSWQASC